MKMTNWKKIPRDITKYQGFVYIISNNLTGKYYIGKKFFWSKKVRPPLKGKKNKRHYVIESDWKDYWGSSKHLLNDVMMFGEKNFTRKILKCCETKWDCAYEELLEQLKRDVLFDNNSYNEIINIRLRKRK